MKDTDIQVGVLLFGPDCGTDPPNVWAKVAVGADWIKQIVAAKANDPPQWALQGGFAPVPPSLPTPPEPLELPCRKAKVEVIIQYGGFPEENSWTLADADGNIVLEGSGAGVDADEVIAVEAVVDIGKYVFTMLDEAADGMDGNNNAYIVFVVNGMPYLNLGPVFDVQVVRELEI